MLGDEEYDSGQDLAEALDDSKLNPHSRTGLLVPEGTSMTNFLAIDVSRGVKKPEPKKTVRIRGVSYPLNFEQVTGDRPEFYFEYEGRMIVLGPTKADVNYSARKLRGLGPDGLATLVAANQLAVIRVQ